MIANGLDLAYLAHRVDKLERQNRRQKLVVLVLLLGALGPLLMSQTKSDTDTQDIPAGLITREMVLVDSELRIRARLGMTDEGPSLEMLDGKGNIRTWLGFQHGEPVISFRRPDGTSQMTLASTESGCNLWLYYADGKERAVLGGTSVGTGLLLSDRSGAKRVSLAARDDGPNLDFYDANGVGRLTLGSAKLEERQLGEAIVRSSSSMLLFDKEGKVIWSAP